MRPRRRPEQREGDDPVTLERGPWWTGRRLRVRKVRSALPLWARLGVASPFRLETTLWIAAIAAAAVGGGALAAVLLPGPAG